MLNPTLSPCTYHLYFQAKKDAVKRLEYDVNVIEKEGRKLHKEYEKVMRIEIPDKVSNGLAVMAIQNNIPCIKCCPACKWYVILKVTTKI